MVSVSGAVPVCGGGRRRRRRPVQVPPDDGLRLDDGFPAQDDMRRPVDLRPPGDLVPCVLFGGYPWVRPAWVSFVGPGTVHVGERGVEDGVGGIDGAVSDIRSQCTLPWQPWAA